SLTGGIWHEDPPPPAGRTRRGSLHCHQVARPITERHIMIELQRTGFFREMPHGEPTDPSLAEARNSTATPHQERVAAYLEAGLASTVSPGPRREVFEPGKVIGPAHSLTDGKFVWPGDLAYYVRTYHVRLPGAFIEHMLSSGWAVPADLDLATLSLPPRPA